MKEELLEIARQLQELTRRLEALAAEEETDETAAEPQTEPEAEPQAEPAPTPEPEPQAGPEPVRFTLNDRYRFLRELFGGSSERMEAATARAAACESAEETARYLADTLGWNLDSPSEHDFFLAVTARFNSRPTLLY